MPNSVRCWRWAGPVGVVRAWKFWALKSVTQSLVRYRGWEGGFVEISPKIVGSVVMKLVDWLYNAFFLCFGWFVRWAINLFQNFCFVLFSRALAARRCLFSTLPPADVLGRCAQLLWFVSGTVSALCPRTRYYGGDGSVLCCWLWPRFVPIALWDE